jgi:protein involved in polysaccharide export with SLBB domain
VVAGLTTEELRRRLVEATSAQLREPEVVVRIAKFGEKTVYVGGEVNKPGLVAYARGLTPLQAVIAAGGFRDTARLDSVVLVRADRTRQDVMTRRLDMNAVLNSGAQEPLELAPSDLVYVPATGVAQANVWVRQHITDMLPFLRTSLPLLP